MVSASPLCSSVRGWVSTDHIPLCSINEDRVSYTEDSPSVKLQSPLCKECGVNSEHMQVDPTQMKVGDGGAMSTGGGTPSQVLESMVGNPPPKTLSPELATDVNQQSKPAPESDFKPSHVSSKTSHLQHCLEASPSVCYDSAPLLRTVPVNMALHEKAEIPKQSMEGAATHPRHQRLSGKRDNVTPNPNPSTGNPGKRAPAQIQSVISLSPGFQCSTHFKPGQPVAFFPTANLSPPLCKITLPPALGQIAALREATANQFSKVCHLQGSNSSSTPQLRPHPYHFSIGRVITPESKPSTAAKHTCGPAACSKSSKVGRDHDSPLDSGASPTIAVPLKQPTLGSASIPPLSLPPSSQGGCSTAISSFSEHSRLQNYAEKHASHPSLESTSVTHARLKSPGATEENALMCSADVRDMPLDLSAKSKRQKSSAAPPKSPKTEVCSTEAGKNDATSLKKAPCAQTSSLGPSAPYTVFPETLKNGALAKNSTSFLDHQGSEASASWGKISSPGSINPPGTYVGVASPVLASTLRSKDGKGTSFVEDLQSTAKQETISIVDQGEHLGCRGRKGPSVIKDPQKCPTYKHSSDIRLAGQPKDVFPLALSGPAKSHTHCTLSCGKAVIPHSPNGSKPAWRQLSLLPHQGASALRQKKSHGAPQSQLGNGSEGVPFQDPLSNASHAKEEKWDKTKFPISNLESIVKPLETSELPSDGCRNLTTLDTESSEAVAVHVGYQDAKSWQVTSREFQLLKSSKKREGKLEKDLQGGVHTRVSCKQEKWIATEQKKREKTPEKRLKQEENSGSNDFSNTSRTHDKNKRRTKFIHDSNDDNAEVRSVTESLSPCVKLEGIAFSILKGQCTGVTELKEKATGTKDMKNVHSKARAPVNKCKKLSSSKIDKLSTENLRKMVACTKKSQESKTKKAKKQKKQPVPGLELSQPEAEEGKRKRGGRGSIASAEQLSHSQAGGVSSDFMARQSTADQGLQQSSPGRPRREGQGATPRLRRGRRPTEKVLQENQSPSPSPSPPPLPPLPPPPPSPSAPFRRPRGRPRSNPLPNQTQGAAATPATHGGNADTCAGKKRRRRWNRKYQNGEYIVERDQTREEPEEKCVTTRQAARAEADLRTTGVYPRQSATLPCVGTSPESGTRRALLTRSGSARRPESCASPEPGDKPAGKRKFKSKHLSDTEEEKLKSKRGHLGKRAAPAADADSPPAKRLHPPGSVSTPKGLSSPLTGRRGSAGRGGAPESSPVRPAPPEVRRLIVNKNAGETLLQRAARLGYQEVVLYCLEKDVREVNRRDNAGYTALHEACSRGWAHIVRVLLDHGADVNCSAQDGTRPIHDAVVNDNMTVVWMLLNHGADPTLATYSGQTALKLAQSNSMKKFLMEYFADLEGRDEQDPGLCWDFYSSAVFESEEKACWDFLLSLPNEEEAKETEERTEGDCFLFEFSAEPLLPCYHIQVSLTQGFCNWFLLSDVLRRLKMSTRIFRARYPHFEVVGISRAELCQQASVSQVTPVPGELWASGREGEGPVEMVRCVPDLQGLLGSTMHILEEAQSR
ncbi:BCL-6 corepressor-like protein 1 isoform X1 [Anguilla anguilla]|uniref:BCL-6 corepressor-like protein 1 isoform X1 n=1 Tax=Anguilla anguilla TaxID=7936 RepID=UPI0015B2D7CC|nr:BCL-6 corepressor-like protein 1 isoform X1 [Anguilla anguilla]XP_035290467.1 BCL-6 corepressor-like protein 1 isoform X1 [Anguilla anguilla]XP_035290468.1 BCL-6 corepressor-like protein 1 isoform X1 [Anguilla anguilla]XP_035290469.1 BCL-6 corepressor-like protein 1 isoform X1 [Anguilla anguilla]XP_035290470.1 BCL-6 corepressor-like protein 1 isoform X1 [Anguilla anguilla]XP_035290471.1 BCL-6 corepressor-like protein 1 isoform X1 [Anguilla anguilla]XP_035290472.1 BCL-6 corepressor-like pro